jgi:SAM-dependent methyltransferase
VSAIIEWLRDPSLSGIDVDGPRRLEIHARMLARKRMLREVFQDFHALFHRLDRAWLSGEGARVELGAGVAPIRESFPDVLATDVVEGPNLDRVLNAQQMDLPDASVRAFFVQNAFHHFPEPDRFLAELERVLVPGGGAVVLEPYYGPAATFLFKRLFRTEGYDKAYPSWNTPATGPMNGANQALSYIVFVRDRAEFERRYPSLEIVHQECIGNYLKYILSGGLNFRQLLPDAMSPAVDFVQGCLRPLARVLSLHHAVVIRKKARA